MGGLFLRAGASGFSQELEVWLEEVLLEELLCTDLVGDGSSSSTTSTTSPTISSPRSTTSTGEAVVCPLWRFMDLRTDIRRGVPFEAKRAMWARCDG